MAIYMKISGVSGNVTAKGYENWINLHDVEFGGVNTLVDMHVGQRFDRMHKTPKFNEITLAKTMDSSSIALFEHVHSATVIPEVEIHYVTTGDPNFTYNKLMLKDVIISHYRDHFRDGSQHPTELLSLAYATMQRTYIPRLNDNRSGSPISTGYDLETAEKL